MLLKLLHGFVLLAFYYVIIVFLDHTLFDLIFQRFYALLKYPENGPAIHRYDNYSVNGKQIKPRMSYDFPFSKCSDELAIISVEYLGVAKNSRWTLKPKN